MWALVCLIHFISVLLWTKMNFKIDLSKISLTLCLGLWQNKNRKIAVITKRGVMRKVLYIALLSSGYFIAHADSEVYYDSQGFESPNGFVEGNYKDASSQELSDIYPSTPQSFNLFSSTVETLLIGNQSYYTPINPTENGSYAIGLIGSPVGTEVYDAAGTTVLHLNYDSFSVPVNVATCAAIESVTVEFDLSLAALYGNASGSASTNPIRLYFPNTMWNGPPVEPMVNVKLFDEQTVDINFNTELQSQIETGTRTYSSRTSALELEWTSHSVTLPLTKADLTGSTALINISGAGSDAIGENTYVALDNVRVLRNTPAGVPCLDVGDPQAIPSTNTNTLLVLLLSLLSVVGYGVYRKVKVK